MRTQAPPSTPATSACLVLHRSHPYQHGLLQYVEYVRKAVKRETAPQMASPYTALQSVVAAYTRSAERRGRTRALAPLRHVHLALELNLSLACRTFACAKVDRSKDDVRLQRLALVVEK